ncbi:LysR substrate-binding domain-containing protein [Sphingopyxis sp. MWB1]|uniref:LysR substrate-binding domain-containing protein n=1 Tax=Sphingopyxis sp. MWB1 TaxID=1537715 RepID=UPI000519FAC6|nr:LysR substrate-binding domain-containing protein [Sphingopyxis sp. MWB1]
MELRHLRYFLAVAERSSFTRAADALHVSQPALSQQIRDLESELGVRLFDRTPHAVRLTEAGQFAVDHARRILGASHDLGEVMEAYRGVRRGRLRIAATLSFNALYLPELLTSFLNDYPDIDIAVAALPNAEIIARVAVGEAELGIGLVGSGARRASGAAGVNARPLYRDRLMMVCSAAHGLAAAGPVTPQQLNGARFALLDQAFETRAAIEQFFEQHDSRPAQILEFNSFAAILGMVAGSDCLTILPAASLKGPQALGLHFRDLSPAPPARSISLISGPPGLRTPAMRAFETHIRDNFEGRTVSQ